MLLTEAIASHKLHLRAKRRATNTMQWYAEQFAAFDAWRIAHELPDELPDVETLERFLADQQDCVSPATINARYRAFRALFRFLERRRRIDHDTNPIHVMDAPSVPVAARRYVSQADLDLLISVANGGSWLDTRDRLIMSILFYSGLRVGELCNLLVQDVQRNDLAILVRHGKGDKARLVPCAQLTIDLFVRYLYERPAHDAQLLLKSDGYGGVAGHLQREGVRQMIIRRCAQAKLYPAFSPHAFRHGFAMWMLNAGARITTVSTAMGHSDPAVTTAIYAHTTTSTVRREYDDALSRTLRK